MKTTFHLLLLAGGLASAEVLWSFDLAQLPGGWTSTPQWQFTSSGALLDITSTAGGGYSSSYSEYLTSDLMIIPEGVETIQIVLEHDYSMDGWAASGYSCADLVATLSIGGVEHTLASEHGSWGFKLPAIDDSRDSFVFAVTPGDWIQFEFYGHTYAVYGASASLEWQLSLLEIEGCQVGIAGDTWAGIKSFLGD